MRHFSTLLFGCLLIFNACAPKISTSISDNYPTLHYREEVRLIGLQDSIPASSKELGIVKIGDTGFTIKCGWEDVIEKAKLEARKVGGNAIKITKHRTPSAFGSSCHRITAVILNIESFDGLSTVEKIDSTLLNADYALLHIYRNSGVGALVNYDLYLGDSVICRVNNKWKKTIKINKDGLNTLWARTEAKRELPINIKFGNEYYIRCSVSMGAFVGRPKLELVDNQRGRVEFQSIK